MVRKKEQDVSKELSRLQEKEKQKDKRGVVFLSIGFWSFFITSMITTYFTHHFITKLKETHLTKYLFSFLSVFSFTTLFFFLTILYLLLYMNDRKAFYVKYGDV